MASKVLLVLTVFAVTLLGVSASTSCEEDPSVVCIVKAMLKPYQSLTCLVKVTQSFEKLSGFFFSSVTSCIPDTTSNKAVNDFIDIHESILAASDRITKACGSKTQGEIEPGVWCGMKAIYAYVNMRKSMKKAVAASERIEKFRNSCVEEVVQKYVSRFPDFQTDLNECIFLQENE